MELLIITLYKVLPTFESENKIFSCDHSIESYRALFSNDTVYHAVQGGANFWVCGWTP